MAASVVTLGDDEIVSPRVQELSLSEELAGELRTYELGAAAGGAVQDQDCVTDQSLLVTSGSD